MCIWSNGIGSGMRRRHGPVCEEAVVGAATECIRLLLVVPSPRASTHGDGVWMRETSRLCWSLLSIGNAVLIV